VPGDACHRTAAAILAHPLNHPFVGSRAHG
jgi:hypothetical protein